MEITLCVILIFMHGTWNYKQRTLILYVWSLSIQKWKLNDSHRHCLFL